MERLPEITGKELREQMMGTFEKLMNDVAAATNAARTGRLLDDMDVSVNDLCKQFHHDVFQKAVQEKINAAEAAFSPGGPGDGQASGK